MGLTYLSAPRIDCDMTRVVLLSAPGSCCDKRGTMLHSCRCSSGCDKLMGSRVEATLEDMELNSFLNLELKKNIEHAGNEWQDCLLFTFRATVCYLKYPHLNARVMLKQVTRADVSTQISRIRCTKQYMESCTQRGPLRIVNCNVCKNLKTNITFQAKSIN